MKQSDVLQKYKDFSLVLGGPLYQLFRRAHLSGGHLELARRRMIVICLLAWVPLLLLSAFSGQVWGGSASLQFLPDLEVHARFLVALPLLIVAELVVHMRMRSVVEQFLSRDLIPVDSRKRFEAAVAAVFRLRNSVVAELLLIALVYGVGVMVIWRSYAVLDKTAWYTVPAVFGSNLSPAGIWYVFLSMPLFQFLLVRWYFRIFIWMRFLWQVSRIELHLVPTHPDRVGGLGFLANTAYAFIPLALAHGAVLAGIIANRIFHLGATLPEFKIEVALVVVFVQLLVFAPLFLFSGQLAGTRRKGLAEYGTLAGRYVREFEAKWLRGGAPADEPFVGSADVQSLADLGNSFELVRSMGVAPVTKHAIVQLAGATLAPLVPLLLTMMPFEELVKKLFGILF
jgi:hypothetical protein